MSGSALMYIEKDSLLHRMEPLVKLTYLLCVAIMVLTPWAIEALLILFICTLFVCFALGRVPIGTYLSAFKYIVPLFISIVVLYPIIDGLVHHGNPVFPGVLIPIINAPLPFTYGGLFLGLTIGFRILCVATSSLTLVWTTHPRDLVQNLSELMVRGKHLVSFTIAHTFEMGLVYFPVIENELRTITYAETIRGVGADSSNPVSRKITQLRGLLLPLLMRGIRHAQTIAIAMETRAYGAFPNRTFIRKINKPRFGRVFAAIWIAVTIVWIIGYILIGKISFGGLPIF